MTSTGRRRALWVSLSISFLAPGVHADDQRQALGYLDLIARLGAGNEPTGEGVVSGQVEAGSDGNYAPNPNDSHFVGKTFSLMSGSSGTSSHANTVGRHYYGTMWSVAPGVLDIHCYEANNWIGSGFLRRGGGSNPPLDVASDIFNNSWIGNAGGANNEILRRLDFAVNDQDLLIIAGVGNGTSGLTTSDILLSHCYNGVAVGRSDSQHHRGDTLANVDGPGRMKPEIVAPDNATSWSTALVSGVVADLIETGRTWDGLASNPDAQRAEVIKAVLLAGATHRAGWTNNPDASGPSRGVTAKPLDPVFGVDQANVNTSHFIFTGLEQDGSLGPGGAAVPTTGWDMATLASGESVFYRFELSDAKETVSMLLTWNRRIATNFGSFSMPDLDLKLFAVDGDGDLVPLRGDNGLGVFGAGNIASESPVDNIEHLFIHDLAPGAYVLEVSRAADALGTWDAAVAWTMPPDSVELASLTGFSITTGTLVSGTLPDLEESDDSAVFFRSGFGETFADLHNGTMIVNAETDVASPSSLELTIESRINQPSGSLQVRLRDWNTNGFELVGSFAVNQTDTVRTVSIVDAADYVALTGEIDVQLKYVVFVPFFAFRFDIHVDNVQIAVN